MIDGTGNPWFHGDIGIKGDTIAEIGDLSGKTAVKTIDARGMTVSPGFIDMHTHCDDGLNRSASSANLNYLIQGTTTVVTGNCGGSVSLKVAETKKKWEDQGIGTNVVYLVGFGTIRRSVMGEEPRKAKPEEIEKMQAILRQSMKEGAWGMSTGLEYIPDRYADTEEVIELTKVVGEFGGIYTSHMRDESTRIIEAVEETIRIGEETGVPVNIAHFKVCGKDIWGLIKDAVKVVNDARARGIYITADQYPYVQSAPVGPIMSIPNVPEDMEPLAEIRKKMRDGNLPDSEREKLREQYVDELKKALSDKSKKEQIKKLTLEGLPDDPSDIAMWGWHNYTILVAEKNTHLIGKNISDLAREQKRDAFDIVVNLIIDEPDMLYSGGSMSEDDLQYALRQDWLMVSSDGGASPIKKKTDKPRPGHPRAYGSQTKVLRKYVREEKILTLENAIRKMTSLPASFLQMKDRGMLSGGYKADIVIFDPETVRDNSTYADAHQYSSGVEYVIINGKISIENGEYNDALNGKVLLLTENK
ncbi:MAG TPA: D-aminoacylase [Candidatus Aminicenantes bacterium]|nr:D-aminoacylase [Candidatus Aminicenantes bacterium]